MASWLAAAFLAAGASSALAQSTDAAPAPSPSSSEAGRSQPKPASLSLRPSKLKAPRPPAPGWGLASLNLKPQLLQQTLLPTIENKGPLQGPPQGFINLNVPKEFTAESVATEVGIFAGKMLLMQQLCGLGRCRVDTGPGDLPMGWVEQISGYGVGAGAPASRPAPRLPSAR